MENPLPRFPVYMENRCLPLSTESRFTHIPRTFKEASSKFLRCAALTMVVTSATLSGFQKQAAHYLPPPPFLTQCSEPPTGLLWTLP